MPEVVRPAANVMKTLVIVSSLGQMLCSAEIPWFAQAKEAEFSAELLAADDIQVQSYQLSYSGAEGPWKLGVDVGWNQYQIDYVPVLFGSSVSLDEGTRQAGISLDYKWNERWTSSVYWNGYDGFGDYRSLWISQFYQQFFETFSQYERPDPHGNSLGASTAWNFQPGTGKAELSLQYRHDHIAPGWSFNPVIAAPEAGEETQETILGKLRVEQVINPWLKSEIAVNWQDTSARENRYGINTTWAAAVGDVGFRLSGGYTEEAPALEAYYLSSLCEWNLRPQWTIFGGYRIYRDTGEIEASGFNAQAPVLNSFEVFVGVLWERGDLNFSGTLGYLQTNYDKLDEDNQFFGKLYKDRDWLTLRIAATYAF